MESNPPEIDPTAYGWTKDEQNKILTPVGLPDGIVPASQEFRHVVKFGCSSNTPCPLKRCSCNVMCDCRRLSI